MFRSLVCSRAPFYRHMNHFICLLMLAASLDAANVTAPNDCEPAFYKSLHRDARYRYAVGKASDYEVARQIARENLLKSEGLDKAPHHIIALVLQELEQDDSSEKCGDEVYVGVQASKAQIAKALFEWKQAGVRKDVAPLQVLGASSLSSPKAADDNIVIFNTGTHKYHCPKCKWAIRCTKNCVKLPLGEAKRRSGVSCKVCGGICH